MYGPVIEGKLVRLRPPRAEDVEAMTTWFDDLEVTQFLKIRNAQSAALEREFLDRVSRDANSVYWIVDHERRAVGGTSIMAIDWRNGFGTTGTVIADKAAWGKGVGREVMQLRAGYAFMQLPLRKLKSGYIEGNEASARAQKSAGYQEVGRWHKDRFVDGEWRDHVLTELLRENWEKGRPPV